MLTSWTKASLPTLIVFLFLFSCSKPTKVEPEEVTPAQYQLKDIRYFLSSGDRLDTTSVKLDSLEVRNLGSLLSQQKVEERFDQLMKKSLFEFDQNTVPQGVELEQIDVQVPENWFSNGSYGYFSEKFTLSTGQQQKPYGAYRTKELSVKVPPTSKIVINRAIDAYYLTCSFEATLENQTTGERHALKGKWKGVVRYNNYSIALKEYPL